MPAQALFLLAIIVGIAAGCLLGTQPSVNGTLSRHVGHPLQATLISFGSGCLIVMILATLLGVFPPRFSVPPGKLRWWVWSGGAIGTVLVTASLIFVPKIGSLPWFAAVTSSPNPLADRESLHWRRSQQDLHERSVRLLHGSQQLPAA